ncbi:MAG: hypothetical protein ACFFAL_06870 [Promethearchaeota archaeon]
MTIIQDTLVQLTPSILGLASFVVGIWLLDAFLRRSDEPGVDVESCLRAGIKILQFFGMAIGVICFVTLFSLLTVPLLSPIYRDILTLILLGLLGFVLLIAPIAKVPWAALIALFVAIIASGILVLLSPLIIPILPFNFTYVLIAVFLITGILVFISLKWFEALIKAFAMILASRPITFILSAIGIIQAILLFLQFPEGILYFLPI